MAVPSDWRRARAERRADERRLPEGLQRDVRVVRRDDLGHDAVQAILDDAGSIARRQGDIRGVHSAGAPTWSYVPPAVERNLLQKLNGNPSYRSQVRAGVRSTLRAAHLTKIDPAAGLIILPEWLPPPAVVDDGVLRVESSRGLGAATALEAEPEGWDHWAACNVVDHRDCDVAASPDDVSLGLDDAHQARRVLVLGALAGGFARAVTAMGASGIAVTEVDWVLPEATNLPCVERRGLPTPMGVFDATVAVFPSAATSGAANQRNIYGQSSNDPARLGVRRWERAIIGHLGLLNVALDVGALAYILLPLGVRHERGYAPAPDLLDRILSRLSVVGFEVLSQVPTVEVEPVAQPFVGTNRPPKVTLVLKKTHAIEGI
jgi:hypothetical protein